MIEIRCTSGDIAWADGPEEALVAARTLMDDDFRARGRYGRTRSVAFFVDDALVRGPVSEQEVWTTIGQHSPLTG